MNRWTVDNGITPKQPCNGAVWDSTFRGIFDYGLPLDSQRVVEDPSKTSLSGTASADIKIDLQFSREAACAANCQEMSAGFISFPTTSVN